MCKVPHAETRPPPLFATIMLLLKGVFFFAELNGGEKKTLRSSQDSNLGPLNSSQMLLPMSYWSSGIVEELLIDSIYP